MLNIRLLLIISLLLVSWSLFAQAVIYNSHYFAPDLAVTYQPVPDSLITYEESGDSLVWDYSQLPLQGEAYKRTVKASEDTPFGERFPTANVAIVGEGKDHVYLRVQHDKTEFIAFVPPDTSYILYNYQPWSISIHPFRLGDTVQTPAARVIQVGERTVYRTGKVVTTAIASGRLLLPNKTYEQVLKIKEVQTFYNPAKTTYYQATTYHWLSNDCNFPLMSCNTIIDRGSNGEEQVTRFAQILVEEVNTQLNTKVMDVETAMQPK